METKITIDMLDERSVSIVKQKYVVDEGIEYTALLPERKAYLNSARGRAEIATELNEPYLTAVMTIWGDTPTITE